MYAVCRNTRAPDAGVALDAESHPRHGTGPIGPYLKDILL